MDKVTTRMEHCSRENTLSEKESIQSLSEKREQLYCGFLRGLDPDILHGIASEIIHNYHEDEFIKSWQELVSNVKHQLVISNPENVKFYDDCKKLVDSISETRIRKKQVKKKSPENLVLKKIIEIDNEIKWLKNHHKEGGSK